MNSVFDTNWAPYLLNATTTSTTRNAIMTDFETFLPHADSRCIIMHKIFPKVLMAVDERNVCLGEVVYVCIIYICL